MSNSNSKVWEDFMSTEFAQRKLEQLKKEAQSADRSKLYSADPKNKTELSKSTETMGVSGGGGSLVGSGDSKSLYTLKSSPVPGGAEDYADAVVEGLEDVHSRMLEVAHKEAKGNPKGTQDNKSEKWEGLQAAGNTVKSFTKSAMEDEMKHEEAKHEMSHEEMKHEMGHAEMKHEMDDDHGKEVDEILEMLKEHVAEEKEHHTEELAKHVGNVSLLQELVKIANDLDAQGSHEDANEIDAVIEAETRNLLASLKAKK